jgi:hypothetical protein
MNQIRNILSFLLIAGAACACAAAADRQNQLDSRPPSDVTAAGAPIFQLDATGNVLVSGTLSGAGCGTVAWRSTPNWPQSACIGCCDPTVATTVAADSVATCR